MPLTVPDMPGDPGRLVHPKGLTSQPQVQSKAELFQLALDSNNPDLILRMVRRLMRLTPDQKIDLYQKAKELRSNQLMNLARIMAVRESLVVKIVNQLLSR
jgi:hypothetical protein